MIRTFIFAALFTIVCNVANATADHSPKGYVTVGAPTILVSK